MLAIHTEDAEAQRLADLHDEFAEVAEILDAEDLKIEFSKEEIAAYSERLAQLSTRIKNIHGIDGAIRVGDDFKQRLIRMRNANQLIKFISERGRRFFYHKGRVSRFEISLTRRLCWRDKYDWKATYLQGQWKYRHFSEGGTLRSLVNDMALYILSDIKLSHDTFGPWPSWDSNAHPWGYGLSDMRDVRNYAWGLGIMDDDPQVTNEDEAA